MAVLVKAAVAAVVAVAAAVVAVAAAAVVSPCHRPMRAVVGGEVG